MHRIGMMSETLYRYKGLKGALKYIKDLGFECADISLQSEVNYKNMVHYFSKSDYLDKAREIKEYAEQINLPLVQAHAPFPSHIDNNDSFNNKEFKNLIKCIEICGVLNIKNLIIHPWNDYDDSTNIEFFKKLLPTAKKNNIVICVENMWRWDKKIDRARPCSCSLPDSFKNIIDGINDPNLKACLDIGHVNMFSHLGISLRNYINELGDRIVCLHIHDNDAIKDRHQIPFDGNLDFIDFIKGLKDINYKGDFILEISTIKNTTDYLDKIKYWNKSYLAMIKFKKLFLEL